MPILALGLSVAAIALSLAAAIMARVRHRALERIIRDLNE